MFVSCKLVSSLRKPSVTMRQMLKECKDTSRPHGHMAVSGIERYRFQYSIPEPSISSIDTWYLVSPSTVPFPFPGRLVPRLLPISSSTWALRRNEPEWWRMERLCHNRNLWSQTTSFQVVIVITRREREDLCSDGSHSDDSRESNSDGSRESCLVCGW